VGPDGTEVFATGYTQVSASDSDVSTFAYDSSTGSELWHASWSRGFNKNDQASALAVTPDGSRVIVAGASSSPMTGITVTVAYSA
jgi:hypothetical protein